LSIHTMFIAVFFYNYTNIIILLYTNCITIIINDQEIFLLQKPIYCVIFLRLGGTDQIQKQ